MYGEVNYPDIDYGDALIVVTPTRVYVIINKTARINLERTATVSIDFERSRTASIAIERNRTVRL